MTTKTPDPWLPANLAKSLDYQQPDYSNLWGTAPGERPTYHSQAELNAARLPKAQAADAANQKMYTDWNTSYQTQKAARDAADYGNEQARYNAGIRSMSQSVNPHFETNAASYSRDFEDNGNPIWVASSKDIVTDPWGSKTTGEHVDANSFLYKPTDWGPDYTMKGPVGYEASASAPLSTNNSASASFGGRINGAARPDFGGAAGGWTPPAAAPASAQVQQLSSSRPVNSMPQSPMYIGAGMGGPGQVPQMGGVLNANRVKPPGT
mgnify:CR=1 FL=1